MSSITMSTYADTIILLPLVKLTLQALLPHPFRDLVLQLPAIRFDIFGRTLSSAASGLSPRFGHGWNWLGDQTSISRPYGWQA
jgi:hypothetical protein